MTSRVSRGRSEPGRHYDQFNGEPLEALHASGVTELVGREEELEILVRRWSKAKTGEGQVVLLSSEPGIGKSRLAAALLERIAAEPHRRLRYFCSPQQTDSALYPIISQIERTAGFAHDDNAQARLNKLDALLRAEFYAAPGRRTTCGNVVVAKRWPSPQTRTRRPATSPEDARSTHNAVRVASAVQSGADGFRGRTLGRSNHP